MRVIAILNPGLEEEGCKELVELGAFNVKGLRRSASFEADTGCLYRLYLQSRLPFRFLREVSRFQCKNADDLYKGVQEALDWYYWLTPEKSFRVDVSGVSNNLTHSHYSALQVKNALVDLQRNFFGKRSDINLNNPDFCLHLHLSSEEAVLSLDGSASSLHKRGYRPAMGKAPLKENLAAGLIRLSGWNGSDPLLDPLCGSGILLIEAASQFLGLSPGLNRSFIINNWLDFNENIWNKECLIAKNNISSNKNLPLIIGCEEDSYIAKQAKENVISAGLNKIINIQNSDFRKVSIPERNGIIVCNPPYGKRLGIDEDLEKLYSDLSDFLKTNASGWQLWVLSGNPRLTRALRMKASKKIPVSNGGIDCRWLKYLIK